MSSAKAWVVADEDDEAVAEDDEVVAEDDEVADTFLGPPSRPPSCLAAVVRPAALGRRRVRVTATHRPAMLGRRHAVCRPRKGAARLAAAYRPIAPEEKREEESSSGEERERERGMSGSGSEGRQKDKWRGDEWIGEEKGRT
ncbi:hypothetical protein U9M48_017298 [Paspalum notatum var. saurae]|uniref:Uncharacterized protein n=1 Tax=Paspalum notatum var. saurae TaxID=547442 RepID=A0AAQ3T931_PASNO